MVIMTHPEPFILHKPKWSILCYHELCRTVCPSRKWNLPMPYADQFPSYTHRLLASNVWSVNHPFRDWHPSPDIFSPAVIHPKSPPYTQSSHTRSSHHETPKLLESFQQKREGIILKKRVENERRKSHSPKELQTRSSNKRPNSLPKHESISLHLIHIPQDQNLVKFQSFMDLHSAWQYR